MKTFSASASLASRQFAKRISAVADAVRRAELRDQFETAVERDAGYVGAFYNAESEAEALTSISPTLDAAGL